MVRHRRISGSALRWERMHRDAAKALAAQAAEAMAGLNPTPVAREGAAGEPDMGFPITEQNQRLAVRVNAQAARTSQDSSGV